MQQLEMGLHDLTAKRKTMPAFFVLFCFFDSGCQHSVV